MSEQLYDFKIVPQQERYYNSDSNWGVYTFTTTDDIPNFYSCCDDLFNENSQIPAGALFFKSDVPYPDILILSLVLYKVRDFLLGPTEFFDLHVF